MKTHIQEIIKVFPSYLGLEPVKQTIQTTYSRKTKSWLSVFMDEFGFVIDDVVASSKEDAIQKILTRNGIQ